MLKHLTLSSGWMQKQKWMLHLYWIEVIRRYLSSRSTLILSHPPPSQTVQSWESGPVLGAALRRGAAARSSRPAGLPSPPPHRLQLQLWPAAGSVFVLKENKNAQANSANPPEGREEGNKKKDKFSVAVPEKDARQRSEETGDSGRAAGVTL